MNGPSHSVTDAELRAQRERIRRGLLRANAAALVILGIILLLALAAVLAAWRADQSARAAQTASQEAGRQRHRAERELGKSRLAEARALRLSGEAGRRERALAALREAARLAPDLTLRNEAVACLALTDLETNGVLWPLPEPNSPHAVDPALEHFALGQTNGEITIHRFSDGLELQRLPAPTDPRLASGAPWRMQFNPSGDALAVVYENGGSGVFLLSDSNRFLPLDTVARLTLEGPAPLQFSPDGNWLALVRPNGAVRLYDLAAGGVARTNFTLPDLRAAAFHPQNRWLALAGFRQVRVVDWDTGAVVRSFTNAFSVSAVAFRSDGRQLAAAAGEAGVTLWNLDTGEPLALNLPTGLCYELNYSPDGNYVSAALGEGVSRIWDTRTGQLLHRLPEARVSRFAPDGRRVAFLRPREGIGVCRFSAPTVLRTLRFDTDRPGQWRFWSAELSDDARWLAAVDNEYFVVWDVASGQVIFTNAGPRRLTVAWLPQERAWLTSGRAGLTVWPMSASETNATARVGSARSIPLKVSPNFGQATLASDGRTVAVVNQPGTALVFDLAQPEQTRELSGPAALGHLDFSPDNQWLAGSSTAGSGVLVWRRATGELVRRITAPHGRVAWSGDARWLALGAAREYSFFDTGTWRQDDTRTLTRGNLSDTTGALACSRDGRWLAVARDRDRVQWLDAATGVELVSLTAPQARGISWLRFSADGRMLAAATFEGAVQVWNLRLLQTRLVEMGLDWNAATMSGATVPGAVGALRTSLTGFIGLIVTGVVLALGAAVFGWQRQRHLLRGYLQVDALAIERAQALDTAQAEILHSQKMTALGTLAAGIAHDFNNLLSVIRMSNQLTGEETAGQTAVAENVAEVEQAVQQGKKIVRSMLGYSRETPEESGPFSLAELVEDAVGLLSKQFLSGVTLTLQLDYDAPPVTGSRSRLEQILLNLVVNASEAMEGHGTLRIFVQPSGALPETLALRPRGAAQHLTLAVADSGPGIEADILPRIFEPFFTTKNRGATRGTGLGLSMVYTMAEQEGWGISIETQVGRGTTFCILVPVAV